MNELNLDAESITRNKSYGAFEHLIHLLKIGWPPNSQVIKKLMKENNLTDAELTNAMNKLKEANDKQCCIDRANS